MVPRLPRLALWLLPALLLAAPPALAHAFPRSSNPAAGATLATPPAAVTIDFTEDLEPDFSTIEVTNAAGKRVDKADPHLVHGDHRQLGVDLQKLPAGTYTVVWHATSVDTHKTQGRFDFTVAP